MRKPRATKMPAELRDWYLTAEHGVTDTEVAEKYNVARSTANRWRKELGAVELVKGRYTLHPTEGDYEHAEKLLARRKSR